MSAEYRIEFSIQRRLDDEDDFTEIGFGSSSAWDTVSFCAYMIECAVEHGEWETKPGMPDPDDVMAEIEATR